MSRTKAAPLKGNKVYKDAPRFKAIYGYEDDFKKKFSLNVRKMLQEVSTLSLRMIEDETK